MATAEELISGYRSYFLAQVGYLADEIKEKVGSPIEELMVWGLLNYSISWFDSYGVDPSSLPGAVPGQDVLMLDEQQTNGSWVTALYLQPEVRVGERTYRVDIAMEQFSRRWPRARVFVAIECDGHDFHEKTKAQAERDKKRDRDLQSIGWLVARFTGAEIFKDPQNAAREVFRLAASQLRSRERAEEEAAK